MSVKFEEKKKVHIPSNRDMFHDEKKSPNQVIEVLEWCKANWWEIALGIMILLWIIN